MQKGDRDTRETGPLRNSLRILGAFCHPQIHRQSMVNAGGQKPILTRSSCSGVHATYNYIKVYQARSSAHSVLSKT
jgi:hypothetical protein